ncbi:MAG: poly-beta-hydroxybutyrate polymerase N-terminal domain-containing protein [Xanthobacteraceae bacterium]|jgi:polyhydroxyalkanoate synthase
MSVSEKTTAPTATAPIPLTLPVQRESKVASIGTAKAGHALSKTDQEASTEVGGGRDSYAATALADIVDRSLHAAASRFTMGLSPAALTKAYLDWATHLTFSPGRHFLLIDKAVRKAVRLSNFARRCAIEGGNAEC